ncbi:cytochrome c oxidase subunit 3 [Scytonema millei]|uniref:Heme-copper oxidase subunit III n=1 Tax=Scytonema millei VB511283 TaxID=1245923 RepID=A0A9X5I3D0_9CYAN|nr:heme-copper oxidase subunit III [Scytonema millei]NHC33810.1 heme-copper oxidase subunit III [Scytonema millei VB511283]
MTAERAIAQDVETNVRQHQEHDAAGNSKFGFIVFLLSESVIFLSFFTGYIVYKTTTLDWYPPGVTGLETREPFINTIVLVSSSFVIYVAERYLHDKKLWGFRLFLLITMAMGSYFLFGQAVEWRSLPFSYQSGLFGGTFFLLTGFHGLHVLTGILLQTLMLGRSFIPGNYDNGYFGVEATSLFWHFVDVIWIVLYTLIYVWQ